MFLRRMISLLAVLLLGIGSALPVAAEREVLTVWDWWGHATPGHTAWYTWLETEFEARYPDIDVEFHFHPWSGYLDKLVTGVAGGAGWRSPSVRRVGATCTTRNSSLSSTTSSPRLPPAHRIGLSRRLRCTINSTGASTASRLSWARMLSSTTRTISLSRDWTTTVRPRVGRLHSRRPGLAPRRRRITRSGYAFFTSVGDFGMACDQRRAACTDFTGRASITGRRRSDRVQRPTPPLTTYLMKPRGICRTAPPP